MKAITRFLLIVLVVIGALAAKTALGKVDNKKQEFNTGKDKNSGF